MAGEASTESSAPGHPVLPPELLEEFLRLGPTRAYPRGTVVVNHGDPADALYVIREGQLVVFVTQDDGRELVLNRLGPGDTMGEMMLDGQTRSASVRCATPATLTMIRRPEFERILAERPDIAFRLIQGLIWRVRLLSRDIQGLVSLDVYGRLLKLVEEQAKPSADGTRLLPGRWSQRRLAEHVGASASMVNRIVKELVAGGYVEVSSDGVRVMKALPRRW